ncbi:MAG TPA: DUF5682 family protein [Mycobacteriales bacterium]|nr:DUF5682 family protein [Mycobacteriales bacterium]
MSLTVVGVRHHSPACARLVQRTIERLRPAHVLVEGPADMNGRIDELLLDHELPVAVFSSLRTDERVLRSWSPLCAHSPEQVALRAGREAGAQVRFMDLPAWHPAFGERENRYSDAERRYARVQQRLCEQFGVDNTDVLWDTLVEVPDDTDLAERLAAYFDLLRDDLPATDGDAAREAYMAAWLRAAVADAQGRPVVAVCGGFHRQALLRLAAADPADPGWPEVPEPPEGAVGGSFIVPFSFRRLDAFAGYASGMPSPGYYQDLWEVGAAEAAQRVTRRVVQRLRARRQPVSTADLVAAAALTAGLAQLRGHAVPARTDVLDGLVSALVSDALEVPLPWAGPGRLRVGTDAVVVEMVAALSGDAVGRLHPDTPAPPLVHDVAAELERHAVPEAGGLTVLLADEPGLSRSRVLHRLAVLGLPGWDLLGVSTDGVQERWECTPDEHRHAALAEAGAYGRTLAEAAGARLAERAEQAGGSPGALADVLEAAVRCGLAAATRLVVDAVGAAVRTVPVLDGMGELLRTVVRVRRRTPGSELLPLLGAAVRRTLWLLEGETGAQAPADPARELAVLGLRDAALDTGDRPAVLDLARRLADDRERPADLRGACVGLLWVLEPTGGSGAAAASAARSATTPGRLGDWLAGLFAVAREQVLLDDTDDGVLAAVDATLTRLTSGDFLAALPALRQAFAWFPPREREQVAALLLARRGLRGSAAALLRTAADPLLLARAAEVEARVTGLLTREHLLLGVDP